MPTNSAPGRRTRWTSPKKAVLQHRRGNVVEHGQRHGGGELFIGEWHVGGVAFDDGDIGVLHPLAQRSREGGIELQAGEPLAAQAEKVGCEARSWADFQYVFPEVHAAQHAREYFALQNPFSSG